MHFPIPTIGDPIGIDDVLLVIKVIHAAYMYILIYVCFISGMNMSEHLREGSRWLANSSSIAKPCQTTAQATFGICPDAHI